MIQLKEILVRSPLYPFLITFRNKIIYKSEHKKWLNKGKVGPPPHLIKQQIVKEFARKHNLQILVETGTYMGDMIYATRKLFKEIYSIELDYELYERALRRFRQQKKIKIFHGDSGKVLGDIIRLLDAPVLFWLDGHYSGGNTAKGDKECPIFEEINHILCSSFNEKKHVILIDDARLFTGRGDYPTIKQLEEYVLPRLVKYTINVSNDIIQLYPDNNK